MDMTPVCDDLPVRHRPGWRTFVMLIALDRSEPDDTLSANYEIIDPVLDGDGNAYVFQTICIAVPSELPWFCLTYQGRFAMLARR